MLYVNYISIKLEENKNTLAKKKDRLGNIRMQYI